MSSEAPGGRLAAILAAGKFAVTGEIVPPRSADLATVMDESRGLVGYVDAVNLPDNPTARAHMSPLAAVASVARAGIEPTLQLTTRDRNRLAITSDLLGGWALGARNLMCLTGDPVGAGEDSGALPVNDLSVIDVIRLARGLREQGCTPWGLEISDPPRYSIGVADAPLSDGYDPARLEEKLDAGAEIVWTQIAYDVEALAVWADRMRAGGLFERAGVLAGIVPLRGAKQARFLDRRLYGVSVPEEIIQELEAAGDDALAAGIELTVSILGGLRKIPGIAGVHLMGMGRDDVVRSVIEKSKLFPRPTA